MWEWTGKALTGICRKSGKKSIIGGRVVLMKKNVLDLNDFTASFIDGLHEFVGKRVSLHLISALYAQPGNGLKGNVGKPAHLENWITTGTTVVAGESTFKVTFEWDENIGIPGAFLIKNNHHSEFHLRSLTLENVPGQGDIHFAATLGYTLLIDTRMTVFSSATRHTFHVRHESPYLGTE